MGAVEQCEFGVGLGDMTSNQYHQLQLMNNYFVFIFFVFISLYYEAKYAVQMSFKRFAL